MECNSTYGNSRCALDAPHSNAWHHSNDGSSWPDGAKTPTDPVWAERLGYTGERIEPIDQATLQVDFDPSKVIPFIISSGVAGELFSIQANGDIRVRGKVVTDAAEIVQGLREAVAEATKTS